MKFCKSCGAKVLPGDGFCGNCGSKLEETSILCESCGNELETHEKYCSQCGEAVQKEEKKHDKLKQEQFNKARHSSEKTSQHNKKKRKSKGCFTSLLKWFLVMVLLLIALSVAWVLLENYGLLSESSKKDEETSEQMEVYDLNKEALDIVDKTSADKYRYGIDVNPDHYEAFRRYSIYAEEGDVNAMVDLSEFYREGIWVEKDVNIAIKLLENAAKKGSLEAQWELEYLQQ